MQGRRVIPLVMIALAILLAPGVVWGQGTFTAIDYPGGNLTVAQGINPRGDIVGYYRNPDGAYHAFLLDHGVYARIDYPNAAYTDAWAINAAGDIVGSYTDVDGATHGYLLRRGRFTSFDVPAALFTAGFGINAEGDIVGHFGAPPAGKMNGFLLRNGTFSTYDYPDPNLMTCGMGINAGEDTIVGHYQVGTLVHGFVLSEGVFTTLDIPGAKTTQPYGINPEGDIVGFYVEAANGKVHGFYRDPSGATSRIDVPGAAKTWVRRNNPQGDMVGNYLDAAGVTHGFLFTAR